MAPRLNHWWNDPLLVKEFRVRKRARTVILVEIHYMLAISLLVGLVFLFAGNWKQTPGWEIGATLFKTILYTQALLMLFVSPLVTASAISGEKEQRTFDSLCVAPVTPRRIVWTKLAAALGCFFVMIFVSLPFACTSFILGGVSPGDLLTACCYTFLCTAMIGAIGLHWSARFERSIASIPVAAVIAVLILVFAEPLAELDLEALATISPVVFLDRLYKGSGLAFFGAQCPAWVAAFFFQALISLYFVCGAEIRMHFLHERHYVFHRFLAFVFLLTLFLFIAGAGITPGGAPPAARRQVVNLLLAALLEFTGRALWMGANTPVLASAGRPTPDDQPLRRCVREMLLKPWRFLALLLLGAAPIFAAAVLLAGRTSLPRWVVGLAFFGVVGASAMTWLLLAARLAAGTTVQRRFGGLGAAVFIMGITVLLPVALLNFAAGEAGGNPPPAAQFGALVSPLAAILHLANPFDPQQAQSAVIACCGRWSPVWIPAVIYIFAAAILFRFRPQPPRMVLPPVLAPALPELPVPSNPAENTAIRTE